MADGMDVIKEYLVSLGFHIDDKSFRQVQQGVKQLEAVVLKSTFSMSNAYVKTGTAVVTTIAAVTVATAKLVDKVAQADLGFQKFALHMYMSKDMARQMKIATDALGESLDDIAWIPELRQRYFELLRQERQLEGGMPKDVFATLRAARDTRFEFTKMKVEATYSMMYLAYNLNKQLGDPIRKLRDSLREVNEYITKNMDALSSKVASGFAFFVRMAQDLGQAITFIWTGLTKIWEKLSGITKMFAVGGGFLAMLMNPLTQPFAVITSLLLLLDDLLAFIDGRKSSKTLAPVWKAALFIFKEFTGVAGNLGKLLHTVFDIHGATSFGGILTGFIKGFIVGVELLSDVFTRSLNILIGSIDALFKLISGHPADAKERLKMLWAENVQQGQTTTQEIFNTVHPDAASGLAGIAKAETGGNTNPYSARNPRSTAFGKYQIIKSSWEQWARISGIGANAPKTPDNQEFVANFMYQHYYSKYGGDPRKIAAAWYMGENWADRFFKGGSVISSAKLREVNAYVRRATGQVLMPERAGVQRYTAEGPASHYGISNQVTIHIHESKNPQETGRAVKRALLEHTRTTRLNAGVHGN